MSDFYIITQTCITTFCLICLQINAVLPHSNVSCSSILDQFASFSSEFTACAIRHSRPITLCESCVQDYINITDSYKDMEHLSENGTNCIDRFTNLDRLEIIRTLYKNIIDLWSRAKCYECFQVVDGNLAQNKSTETEIFNEKYQTFMSCINRTDINDTTICPTCLEDYSNLNNYYISISNENEKIGVCMDIVDKMNTTRVFWSLKCCKYRHHDEYLFVTSAIAVLVLTLCFYIVTQICADGKTPTILQQTRLAESLGQINR